jgi:hypothetical protein
MRPLPLVARAARLAPTTQQAHMMGDREAVPFIVPLPLADAGDRAVPQIIGFRLGKELALQHGAVVLLTDGFGRWLTARNQLMVDELMVCPPCHRPMADGLMFAPPVIGRWLMLPMVGHEKIADGWPVRKNCRWLMTIGHLRM